MISKVLRLLSATAIGCFIVFYMRQYNVSMDMDVDHYDLSKQV